MSQLLLSLETATPLCSVALHDGAELVGAMELHREKSHSGHLTPMIEDLLRQCKVKQKDLGAVALSKGPGSYTGLRIGTSTAKGLCYALEIPLLAVNTLAVMAETVRPTVVGSPKLCPMLDARRMEVYCQWHAADGTRLTDTEAKVIEEGCFEAELNEGPVLFFGNGAMKCESVLGAHPNARFLPVHGLSAISVGALAWQRWQAEQTEDVAYFEPFYLKDFVAGKPKRRIPAPQPNS